MEDFRCFRRGEAAFVHRGSDLALPPGAPSNVTLLVGINGSGKTSILRAIALGATPSASPIISESGLRPYYLVRVPRVGAQQSRMGSITLDVMLDRDERDRLPAYEMTGATPDGLQTFVEFARRNDYDVVSHRTLTGMTGMGLHRNLIVAYGPARPLPAPGSEATMNRDRSFLSAVEDEYFKDFSSGFFLLGYAANRRVDEPGRWGAGTADKSRSRRYLRVAGLFEEGVTLVPIASWLPQLKRSARHQEIVRLLNRTLPPSTRFSGRFHKDQQPIFTHDGVNLPFPALSDGYRAYIGLVGDMLCHLNDCCPNGRALIGLSGVVMVDDIDLHLHPQWQRVVVPKLARAFPKLQFILTTHSPLVAGTVHGANVRVIGRRQVHQFTERLHGLSVDQILSSRYFDYTKPRTDASEKQLQALLEGPVDRGDAEPALQFLRELAGQVRGKK